MQNKYITTQAVKDSVEPKGQMTPQDQKYWDRFFAANPNRAHIQLKKWMNGSISVKTKLL